MAFTYQDVLDLARIPLNDEDRVRHPDGRLLSYARQAVLQMRRRRPDLFIGRFGDLPDGTESAGSMLPLPAEYAQLVADYVTARAEMVDDEHAGSGRAALFMRLYGMEVGP